MPMLSFGDSFVLKSLFFFQLVCVQSKRLGLPELTNTTPMPSRHYEATCPPKGAPVSDSIPCKGVDIASDMKKATLLLRSKHPFLADAIVVNTGGSIKAIVQTTAQQLPPQFTQGENQLHLSVVSTLRSDIPSYSLPERTLVASKGIKCNADGSPDEEWLKTILSQEAAGATFPQTDEEREVQAIFAEVLGLTPWEVPVEADFFSIGGDSFRSGKVVSALRNKFALPLNVASLYQHKSAREMAAMIANSRTNSSKDETDSSCDCSIGIRDLQPVRMPCNPVRPVVLFVQALPLVVFMPMLRMCTWMLFLSILASINVKINKDYQIMAGMCAFVVSALLTFIIRQTAAPLLSILVKWVVIGKYKEGVYPTFSPYYLRWWFVDQMLQLGGKGFFTWHQ